MVAIAENPQAQLQLDAPRSTARLGESWPIRFEVNTRQPQLATCRPADWTSRIVWQVSRVGKGVIALQPLVATQAAAMPNTPLILTPQRPLFLTVNLRKYTPVKGVWQPGLYRVNAKLALCSPDNPAEPLWLNSRFPVYLDITP